MKTGLKYFGKTTAKDPYSYPGSGKYWQRHCDKHGWEHVRTCWVKLLEDEDLCILYALFISTANDIVASPDWANLKPENGVDGGYAPMPGQKNHRFGRSYYVDIDGINEHCLYPDDPLIEEMQLVNGRANHIMQRSKEANLGNQHTAGRRHTEITKLKISASNKAYGHKVFLG
jgi:hypothetical protein